MGLTAARERRGMPMALQQCGLNLNRVSKELQPHGSLEFPCAGYSSHHTGKPEDIIPWHWHEEIEIVRIEEGKAKLKTPASSFLLGEGQVAVINSNVLHYAEAVPECTLHSLVFSPSLITGGNESAFAKKYILPLLSCRFLTGYQIESDFNQMASDWFVCAFDALENESRGFEFTVRENLSHICFYLYETFESQLNVQSAVSDQDNIRIQKMLNFLHKNFADNLSLREIADAADISERECLRCFQKMLQISPVQYLLKYRVMQGAAMLLANPAGSISETASYCGFDSPSHFAKMFKRFYNCTPREYRQLNAV